MIKWVYRFLRMWAPWLLSYLKNFFNSFLILIFFSLCCIYSQVEVFCLLYRSGCRSLKSIHVKSHVSSDYTLPSYSEMDKFILVCRYLVWYSAVALFVASSIVQEHCVLCALSIVQSSKSVCWYWSSSSDASSIARVYLNRISVVCGHYKLSISPVFDISSLGREVHWSCFAT